MADFNSKIATIKQDLDGLLQTLSSVDAQLKTASADFSELAAHAKDISTLSSAIQKLSKFLDSNKSPFLNEIRGRVKEINTELNKLNVSQLQTATGALEANAKAIAAISRSQANVNRNLETAKTRITELRTELGLLEQQSTNSGGGLEASVKRLEASLTQISSLTGIQGIVTSLNALEPAKYNQTADALERIRATVVALKNANVSIDVSAASQAEKLVRKPIQPVVRQTEVEVPVATTSAPTPIRARPRTVQFAQEQGIDLASVQGSGARGTITKDDVLRYRQQQQNVPIDPSLAQAKIAEIKNKLEQRQASFVKLDEALDQIEAAKQRAFLAAVKEHGLRTPTQVGIARRYLLPEEGTGSGELYSRKKDFEEIRKNKTFDDLENEFQRQLRKTEVKTNLPGDEFGAFKANNDKIISTITELRNSIKSEIERLASELGQTPELSIGSAALTAKQLAAKQIIAARGEALPTSADYILNKVAGRRDLFTGGTGAVDESRIAYDERTRSYSTRGNGVVGANDAEFEANRAAIERAVRSSPNGIAVLGSTGANLGGASLITGDKTTAGIDHVAIAFLDALTGQIRIREKNADVSALSGGNKAGIAGLGNIQAAERSLDEFAAKVDRVTAVSLNAPEPVAGQFREKFLNETETDAAAYSFKKSAGKLTEAGDTCASVFQKVAKDVGLLDVAAKFEGTPGIGKKVGENFNIVTPHDVITAVQQQNAGGLLSEQQTAGTDLRFIDQIKLRLTDVFKNLGESLKNAFESFKKQTKDVTFGDIFSYIKSVFTQGGSPVALNEAGPELSVGAAGIRTRAAEFSKNYYRPFQTGLTYFGAGLNSVQEIAKGVQTGGPGGLLDIAGGAIKGVHTLANANAYFGLGILPKGVGEVFNQRRSETLLDIIETIVGAKTGYRRSSVDKNYTALKEQEAPLVQRKEELKAAIEEGNLSPDDLTKAHNELNSVTQELRELRQAISAYRRVIAEEAKRGGGTSTGKQLSEEALKEADVNNSPVRQAYNARLKQNELLSKQAEESLARFSVGTGFAQSTSGGLRVQDPREFGKTLREIYGPAALRNYNPEQIKGANLPGNQGILINAKAQDYADTAVHEAVHRVANAAATLPKNITQAPIADASETAILLSRLKTKSAQDVLSAYSSGPTAQKYFNQSNERYAYTGQALISGNKELEEVLQHIYGKDLYNQLVADLKTSIPDTFGDEALAILRQRFAAFQAEFNSLFTKNPELSIGGAVKQNLATSANAVVDEHSASQLANAAIAIQTGIGQQNKLAVTTAGQAAHITAGIGQGVDLRPIFQELRAAFKENFGSNLQEVSTKLIQLTADIPQYQNLLIKAISPNSGNFARIAQTATELYIPQGTPQRRAYEAFNAQGGEQLTHALIQAIQEPTKESFSKLFESAKKVDIQKVVEQYVTKLFTEGGLDIKGGLIANQLFKGGKATIPEIIGTFATQFAPKDINFRDELNARVRATTGRNIAAGSFSQQAVFDPTTGLQKFSLSARTADGAMVSLNAHVDEFGKKIIEEPKGITRLHEAAVEFFRAIPRQLADQFTYGVTDAVQQMFRQLVGIQDELSEVANLLGVVGDKATQAKSKFLFTSVQTAVQTGQGFDEAIQTNLKNFKILGNIKDTGTRESLANQISGVQLGAQTAFGISLEQGLEAIPAILSTIKDGMTDIEDPTEKVRQSVQRLREVMDEVVVAQRATGAQGDELITVYSRLAESAKEYGLNSKQLLGITATSSVAIGRGSEETSNILRSFLEGTYSEANQGGFAKAGIATKVFNAGTNQLENRSFEDILKDLFKLSQDQSRGIEYNQLLQSIAGPKLKPDIAKIVAGFGRNYASTEEQLQATQGGTFEKLVGQKSQNVAGSLNKLEATGTQLFGSILVGTGAFDKLAKFFDNLSDSAVKLTNFLNENQDAIKHVVDAIGPFIKFFTVGQLSKDLNIFAPIAKGINTFETAIEATKAKIIDFGAVGEGAPTGITRTLKLTLAVLKEMQEVSARTGEVLVEEFNKAASTVDRFNNASKGAQAQLASNLTRAAGQYQQLGQQVVTSTSATVPLQPEFALGGNGATFSNTPIKQRLALAALSKQQRADEIAAIEQQLAVSAEEQKAKIAAGANVAARLSSEQAVALAYNIQSTTPLSDRIRNRISSSSASVNANLALGVNTLETIVEPQRSRLQRIRGALEKPGAAAGALAAPVAFDLLAGGTNKDNLINVGAGIAGGIAGAFVGGPFGATIGYSIAKGVAENIDLAGKFGTSSQEAQTFAEAIAEKIFNKKPPEGTTEEQQTARAQAANQLNTLSSKLGIDALKTNLQGLTAGPATRYTIENSGTQVSSAQVKRYLDIQNGLAQPGFFEQFQNNAPTQRLIGAFGGNKDLLDLYARAGVSNIQEFITQIDEAARGIGPLAEEFSKLSVQTQAQATASAEVVAQDQIRAQYQSAQDIIQQGQQKQSDLEARLQNAYQVPYGLNTYNAFTPQAQGLNTQIANLRGTGPETQAALERLTRSQESLAQLPTTLQQLIPLAQSLGLNSQGLEQRLYNVGSQGQQQVLQRFQPAIEADRFTQSYELQRSRLAGLQATDLFKAKQPEIVKEVEALQKALATDKARYDINKAFLELLKSQSGALLDQTGAIEAQNKTRQLISAGTAAQFTPASIFDTKGTTATELNNAIDFALRKQARLSALNPEYRKEFAKDQFLLQSGLDFKPVTGVNQGFVQEYLQQQRKQEAPLQDLSQFSDQQIQKILDQARSLQGQAEKLDPSRVGKYENDRILILKKNNELLAQTGLGQEFLKAAIDANTKSNDTLRGHYNLPSNYKAPTIFDYYAAGGTERGDKNFPTLASQGLVPLSFAQQLAQQLINPDNKNKGADLSAIGNTRQPGARPLFYPNPGTAAVYSEVEPQLIPDTIKSDKHISDAVQRFFDFKDRQAEDFDNAARIAAAHTNSILAPAAKADRTKDDISPYGYVRGGGGGGSFTFPGDIITHPNRGTVGPDERPSTKAAEAVTKFATASDRTKDDLVNLGQAAQKVGTSVDSIGTALPSIGTGASSLATGASSFNSAVTALVAKVQAFDLAAALRNANVQIQVTVNGQTVSNPQVTITTGASGGQSTLAAGPGAKSGERKLGGSGPY